MDPGHLSPLPSLTPAPRRTILAISGGGYAGLFAAEFLRRLEGDIGRPLAQVFDLIAGTSIGGVIALGLAKGLTAAKASELIEELGPDLFGRPRPPLLRPKHDRRPLADKMEKVFSDVALRDLSTGVLVPAVDLTAGATVVFGNAADDATRAARVVDVALATSAAPIYLAPASADERLYADGGLAANSPEALAAVAAIHERRWEVGRATMIVVGSTRLCGRVPAHLEASSWGLKRWLRDGRLQTTAMRAQMSLARRLSTSVLGRTNVLEADVELSAAEQKIVSLDKADAKSTEVLKGLAAVCHERFLQAHDTWIERLK